MSTIASSRTSSSSSTTTPPPSYKSTNTSSFDLESRTSSQQSRSLTTRFEVEAIPPRKQLPTGKVIRTIACCIMYAGILAAVALVIWGIVYGERKNKEEREQKALVTYANFAAVFAAGMEEGMKMGLQGGE